jgi:hypothetical protein
MMIGEEEKGIESRHPMLYIQARRKGRWGDRAIYLLTLTFYVYVVTMTIPALDQYLAIGQSTLQLPWKEKEKQGREEKRS